jgi:hypothetical protein
MPNQPETSSLFVHSFIDDYGLTAAQFRVLAHLSRREGKDGAYPSVPSMARICRLNIKTVQSALKFLRESTIVRVTRRNGTSSLYHVSPFSEWAPPIHATPKRRSHSMPKTPPDPSTQNEPHKGSPLKGNPPEGDPESKHLGQAKSSILEGEREFQERWNAETALRPVQELSKTERGLLQTAMADSWFRNNWKEAISTIGQLPFCTGKTEQRFNATPYWFLKPGTVEDVLSGKYNPRPLPLMFLTKQRDILEKIVKDHPGQHAGGVPRALTAEYDRLVRQLEALTKQIVSYSTGA